MPEVGPHEAFDAALTTAILVAVEVGHTHLFGPAEHFVGSPRVKWSSTRMRVKYSCASRSRS